MEQEKPERNASETMAFGLIDQADRLGKAALATQHALTEQIQELAQVQAWAVEAAVDLQKRANAAIKSLEAERAKLADDRAKLQAIGPAIEQGAVWAMRETLREQAGQIKYAMKTEVSGVFAESLQDIRVGAGHVRKNARETKLLTFLVVLLFGILLGYAGDQYRVGSRQNSMEAQMNSIQSDVNIIEGYLQRQEEQKKDGSHPGKGK